MDEQRTPLSPKTILALVMGGLVVWGIYVAVGVLVYGLNPLGAILVLVFVALFLGIWLLLLRSQNTNRRE